MAFQGGTIPVVAITPGIIQSVGTQVIGESVQLGVNQLWKGSGQTFLGQAGQALTGQLANSAVNVALNPILGAQLPVPVGQDIFATSITPFITSTLAAGINQNIEKSLQAAGPFGPILSGVGTTLVNQLLGGLTSAIAPPAEFKGFPGGGDEPEADYGGSAYTLGDVVFSLQPANQGPQQFGLEESLSFPKSATTLPFNDLTSMPSTAGNFDINKAKFSAMSGFTSIDPTKPFSSRIA